MTQPDFEQNIELYSLSELENILKLPTGYSINTVGINRDIIKNNIGKNMQMNENVKNKALQFIDQIGQRIMSLNSTTPINTLNTRDLMPSNLIVSNDHMIQERSNGHYNPSFPSEFFSGTINPLKKRTINRNLSIDTRFRSNYYASSASNFKITLPTTFNQVISMNLKALELPVSFYNVSTQYGNNFFNIVLPDSTAVQVVIPSGNYTRDGIVVAINSALINLPAPFSDLNCMVDLTVNGGSCKMMFGYLSTAATTPAYSLNFQANINGDPDEYTPLPLKFGWMLGFRNGIYENNLNYVSEGIVDMRNTKYIYLVVDEFTSSVNNGFYSAFNSSVLNKNILARISLNEPNGLFTSLIENNFNIVSPAREYFGPINIQDLQIQLLDDYGRILNLNNMDYSFCLGMTIVYDI